MDFNDAREKHPARSKRIDELEKRYKLADIVLNLQEHVGVQELLKGLRMELNRVEVNLLTNRKMTQQERDNAFTESDCWNYLIDFFTRHEITKHNIKTTMEKM